MYVVIRMYHTTVQCMYVYMEETRETGKHKTWSSIVMAMEGSERESSRGSAR